MTTRNMGWEIIMACFNGPRVYRKYRTGNSSAIPQENSTGAGTYKSNFLEDQCGFVVGSIETCWTIILYTSPILAASAAFRRSIIGMSPEFALKFALGVVFVYGGAYLGRGLGRAINKEYLSFLHVLISATQRNETCDMRKLRNYDFDFRHWPVNYQWREIDKSGEMVRPRRYLPNYQPPPFEGSLKRAFMDGLAFMAAHTVARRLAYPGTLGFLQTLIKPALDQGRTKLVEQMNGQRFKLQTRTGNDIDSMFVDRRNKETFTNGNILIVTCEGNGGFYEVGSAATPLEAGYSVLMWNHPGFGGSTGVPWPSEETAAIDVVVQFALNQLGWNESDVVIYGWSIGGFTATWVAMNYENIRGLILDATFDDIVPLAIRTMPQSWAPIVGRTVLKYFNLRIEKQLAEYRGPVSIIRRLKDEIMAADGVPIPEPNAALVVNTAEMMRRYNRANNLLKGILADRYPNIFHATVVEVVDEYLAASDDERVAVFFKFGLVGNWRSECRHALAKYVEEHGDDEDRESGVFPLLIGADYDSHARNKIALYLASSYLVEFDSSHNMPLPMDKFSIPKQPWE